MVVFLDFHMVFIPLLSISRSSVQLNVSLELLLFCTDFLMKIVQFPSRTVGKPLELPLGSRKGRKSIRKHEKALGGRKGRNSIKKHQKPSEDH